MRRELRNVLHALPQRGHLDRHDVEAIEQVFAELALRDQALEIPVRGRDHAHVHGDVGVPAHPSEGARFEDAQQLRLELRGHLSDFVQQQRPAIRELEETLLELLGVREGSLLVPEQLTSMNGPSARALCAWRCRAMSSFPVPVSPSSSTMAVPLAATRSSICTARRNPAL